MPEEVTEGMETEGQTEDSQAAEEGQGQTEEERLTEIYEAIEAVVADMREDIRPVGIQDLLADKPLVEQWQWLEAHGHEFMTEGGE